MDMLFLFMLRFSIEYLDGFWREIRHNQFICCVDLLLALQKILNNIPELPFLSSPIQMSDEHTHPIPHFTRNFHLAFFFVMENAVFFSALSTYFHLSYGISAIPSFLFLLYPVRTSNPTTSSRFCFSSLRRLVGLTCFCFVFRSECKCYIRLVSSIILFCVIFVSSRLYSFNLVVFCGLYELTGTWVGPPSCFFFLSLNALLQEQLSCTFMELYL